MLHQTIPQGATDISCCLNRARLCGQYKKAPGRKYWVFVGEAARQRCLSSFELDTLVVAEVYVLVNHLVSFREGVWFLPVNALCFEDGKEIFG